MNLSIQPISDQNWKVTLKSVKDLKPRLGKEELDFSIALKILPEARQRIETKMYEDLNNVLFDLMDDPYQFDFEGGPDDLLQIGEVSH